MPNSESDATELNTKWFYKTKKNSCNNTEQ